MSNEIVKVSGGVEVSIAPGIPVGMVTALVKIATKQLVGITSAIAEFNHDAEIVIHYYARKTREAKDFLSVPALWDAYKTAQRMIDSLDLSGEEQEKAYLDLARKLEKRREML